MTKIRFQGECKITNYENREVEHQNKYHKDDITIFAKRRKMTQDKLSKEKFEKNNIDHLFEEIAKVDGNKNKISKKDLEKLANDETMKKELEISLDLPKDNSGVYKVTYNNKTYIFDFKTRNEQREKTRVQKREEKKAEKKEKKERKKLGKLYQRVKKLNKSDKYDVKLSTDENGFFTGNGSLTINKDYNKEVKVATGILSREKVVGITAKNARKDLGLKEGSLTDNTANKTFFENASTKPALFNLRKNNRSVITDSDTLWFTISNYRW